MTDDEDEGDRLTPGLEGDWLNEFDREGGHPDDADETENAEVRQVDDGEKTEKSHGDDEADEEWAPEEAEDTDPHDECILPALALPPSDGERSLPGKTRAT